MEGLVFNLQKFSLHDGAGIRTDVFFQGCNLRCAWCSNPESQPLQPPAPYTARRYTVEALVEELIKDKPFYDTSGGGVTLTGGEALLQPDFVCALSDALHAASITVALETAANVPAAVFARVLDKLDLIHIDLKHYDPEAHMRGTGVSNAQTLANIRTALGSGVPTIVRIPVIPGFNNAPSDAQGFARLLQSLGAREVQLLPFHQFGENKYKKLELPYAYSGVEQLHEEDLGAFASVLEDAGLSVQIGG